MVWANFPQKLTRNRSSNDNYKSSFRVLDHYHSFKLTLQNLAATFLNFSPFWNWKSPTFNVISSRSKVYRNADILNRWGDNSGLWETEENPGQGWRKKGWGVGRKRGVAVSVGWRGSGLSFVVFYIILLFYRLYFGSPFPRKVSKYWKPSTSFTSVRHNLAKLLNIRPFYFHKITSTDMYLEVLWTPSWKIWGSTANFWGVNN